MCTQGAVAQTRGGHLVNIYIFRIIGKIHFDFDPKLMSGSNDESFHFKSTLSRNPALTLTKTG